MIGLLDNYYGTFTQTQTFIKETGQTDSGSKTGPGYAD